MTTKRTDLGSKVRIETVASFGGKPARAYGAVLVPADDEEAIRAEVIRQATALRVLKRVNQTPKEPVV